VTPLSKGRDVLNDGSNDGSGVFTIPHRPIHRRVTNLPAFVVNRAGEYRFIPSLSALRWISELDT
jgi:hypothetical protein